MNKKKLRNRTDVQTPSTLPGKCDQHISYLAKGLREELRHFWRLQGLDISYKTLNTGAGRDLRIGPIAATRLLVDCGRSPDPAGW
jgi:hypothetical protein